MHTNTYLIQRLILCLIFYNPFISQDYDDEGEDPADTFGNGNDVDTDYIAKDKRACDTDKEGENADEGHKFHVFCPLQIADECIIDGKARIKNGAQLKESPADVDGILTESEKAEKPAA